MTTLFTQLQAEQASWSDVDRWVARLYDLDEQEIQLIADTLKFNLPFAKNQRQAQEMPSIQEQERFCQTLAQELSPWSQRFGNTIDVRLLSPSPLSPWSGITLRRSSGKAPPKPGDWQGLLLAADDLAASEIIVDLGESGLIIGRLAQRRYWSETQARLLAERVIWSHIDMLRRIRSGMSPSTIVPRPDHIAELTRGLTLPLPSIRDVHLQVIAEAISHAFNDLQNRTPVPDSILTGNEATVTALLGARLNRLIGEDRMFRRLVRSVARGVESLNFDGGKLEFRPDLSIYLAAGAPNFPLIIEAKLIDNTRSKTARLYCERGIARFVSGGYAWGNREAFMIAYVRDASTIDTTLTPYPDRP